MDAKEGMTFASKSVAEHLARGLLGFAALAYAFVKIAEGSPWFVPILLASVVLLRGCPTCWTIGLMETLSARTTRRVCQDGRCTLDTTR